MKTILIAFVLYLTKSVSEQDRKLIYIDNQYKKFQEIMEDNNKLREQNRRLNEQKQGL